MSMYESKWEEQEVATNLRLCALEEIKKRDPVEVATLLGVAPESGLPRLMRRKGWSLAEAFRIGICLNLPVIQEIVGVSEDWAPHD